MPSYADRAVADFERGFACSQSVFAAFSSHFGVDPELARRVSAPFGGGMARQGEVCGALTGAYMVLGLHAGNRTAEDRESKERCYALMRQLTSEFRARHGAIRCRDLLGGLDLGSPEGLLLAREKGLLTELCPKLVRDAAEITEKLMERYP